MADTVPVAPAARLAAPAGRLGLLSLRLFIGYAAWSACAGWVLSGLGRLDAGGYSVASGLCIALAVGVLGWRVLASAPAQGETAATARPRPSPRSRLPFSRRRFRRPLVFIFLLCFGLAGLGGALYAPNNYDMLTYRLPRMLHWLAAGRWHWIEPTQIDRMNYSGCGFEWSALPLFVLTHSTRWFFLPNLVAYMLLPGLFFGVLRYLGVQGRTAWTWMWLLPSGYIFVLQAGSGGNDATAATYLLAALFFAGRAGVTRHLADVAMALLSAAALSATKASNLPLLLPCAIALLPGLGLLRSRIPAAALIIGTAALASYVPTAVLNYRHTGDWSGSPADPGRLKLHDPLAGLAGNTLQLVTRNLSPSVLPFSEQWNRDWSKRIVPAPLAAMLARGFPRFTLSMNELQQEEASGIGLGVASLAGTALIAAAVAARPRLRRRDARRRFVAWPRGVAAALRHTPPVRPWVHPWPQLIVAGGVIALLVLMATLGSESIARLAAPYYPLLLAACIWHPANAMLSRRRWWQATAVVCAASALPCVILTPSRPLFPAGTVIPALAAHNPDSRLLRRMETVYGVYRDRSDHLAPLRRYLPAEARVVGFLASDDDSEVSLWQPWGRVGTATWPARRVTHVAFGETPQSLRRRSVDYVVASADALKSRRYHHITLEQFLAGFGGRVLGREEIRSFASRSPGDWYVIGPRQAGGNGGNAP